MSIAERVWELLEESGSRIHFRAEPGSRRTRVEIQDLCGNTISQLSPSEALQLASGFPFNLDQQESV
jgi:hypothetical protein